MFERLVTKIKIKYLYLKAMSIAYTKPIEVKPKSDKVVYVMCAANYNNLGDIAITKAQNEFIKRNLPGYEIVNVSPEDTFAVYRAMKKTINANTVITLIGGGNSGTLYEFVEWPRRFILKYFRKCKIISFPQSIFYGMSKADIERKKEFIKLCKKCQNLTLVARERQSYEKYKEMLGEGIRVLLIPDIVFSLQIENLVNRENSVLFLFRNDKEKSIDESVQKKIVNIANNMYLSSSYDDTCNIEIVDNGYSELDLFISHISKQSLVITDRLHGMILSYISRTPCIVLDNNNGKIKSTFETWMGRQNYVYFMEKIDEFNIRKLLGSIRNIKKIEHLDFNTEYDSLINILKSGGEFDE